MTPGKLPVLPYNRLPRPSNNGGERRRIDSFQSVNQAKICYDGGVNYLSQPISATSRLILSLALLIGLLSPLGSVAPVAKAANSFEAGNLVSDVVFTANDTMTASDIQAFLEAKGSVLTKVSSSQLGDGAGGRNAAQIIFDATRGSRTDFATSEGFGVSHPLVISLNPQVVLVTLQKEQSLITGIYDPGSATTTTALRSAMGMGCPDGGGCSDAYTGFTNQIIYGVAQLMKNYIISSRSCLDYNNRVVSNCYKAGVTYNFSNTTGPPNNAAPNQDVTIGGAATAALYMYTPHVYNGNYNFWYYLNLWFPNNINTFSPSARVIKGISSDAVYVYSSGMNKKWYVRAMPDLANWGIAAPLEVLTEAEVAAIPNGLGEISKMQKGTSSPNVYYLEGGTKYHLRSEAIFPQYNISWPDLREMEDSVIDQLHVGPPLGLLAKSKVRPEIYLITGGRKLYVPDEATLLNWGFKWTDLDTISQWQIDVTPSGGNLGYLMKPENASEVYLIVSGQKRQFPSQSIFEHWGFSFSMVPTVSREMPPLLPTGERISRVIKGSSAKVYYVENGQRQYVSRAQKLTLVGTSLRELVEVPDSILNLLPVGADL